MFIRMLIATIATVTIQIGLCIVMFIHLSDENIEHDTFMNSSEQVVLNIATLAVSLVSLMALCLLFGFHVYLIKHNLTTLQYIKKQERRRESKVVTKIISENSEGSDTNAMPAELKEQRVTWKQILCCCIR